MKYTKYQLELLEKHRSVFELLVVIANQSIRQEQLTNVLVGSGYCKTNVAVTRLLKDLEDEAGSMPILSEELTGYKNIRKINVRNYIIFYIVDNEKSKAFVVRIGHAFMDWEKYLKDN